MARPIKSNRPDLQKATVQSNIVTSAKFKYNLTEERIKNALLDNLYRMQNETDGLILRNNQFRIHKWEEGRSYTVQMPISDIIKYMGSKDKDYKNYEYVKEAAKSIQTKIFEVENTATGDYWGAALIMNVSISKRTGMMKFLVADWLMTALLDMTHGFTTYELEKMQSLKTQYAMRAYELVSNATSPVLKFSSQKLKEFFGVEDKYPRDFDFQKRILKPSKKELDKSCPWTFDYTVVKASKAKNAKVLGYNIYPKHQPQFESEDIQKNKLLAQVPAGGRFGGALDANLYRYLKLNLNWTKEQVEKNKKTFVKAQETIPMDELLSFLSLKSGEGRTKQNPIGYVINSLKGEIADREEKKAQAKAAEQPRQRSLRDMTSVLVNQFSVREQDVFNPNPNAKPIPYRDGK